MIAFVENTKLDLEVEEFLNDGEIGEIDDLIEYFKKVDILRRSIIGASEQIKRLNESPNPFYGVIPFDGSLVLNEYYRCPSEFYTPLGKWKMSGGGGMLGDTISLLNSLGIKWTRLTSEVNDESGCFGGTIQIDEDQFGNKYSPYKEIKNMRKLSYEANSYLFSYIRWRLEVDGFGDILRPEIK